MLLYRSIPTAPLLSGSTLTLPPASTIPVPAPTPETGAPPNANVVDLPAASDQAGRWSGILIVDPIVKKTVVGIVISKFKVQFQHYINKVADSAPRPGSSSLV